MNDMFGREVNIGDTVIFHSGSRLVLVEVTKYNPKTNRVSVKPFSENGEKTYGWHGEYSRNKMLLVRDLDMIKY